MNTGEWAQIPNSSINSVLVTKPEADAIDPRIWGTGSREVIRVWTSSAYDQAGHRWFFGVAGGHASYNGNELYTYDLETLSWSRMYDPSPMTSNMSHGDPIPAWGPQAAHHYDGLIYSPKTNSIFVFGAVTWNCQEFSLDQPDPALAWTVIPCPDQVWSIGYGYYKTAINPDNQNIIIIGGGLTNTAEFDPATKKYSKIGGRRSAVMADYTVADLDPVRRRMYSLSTNWGKGVLAVRIDSNPMRGRIIRGSGLPANLGNNACFVHHPPSGLMVAWNGGRKVWTFDPDAVAWTQHDNAAGAAPTSSHGNGPLGKCIYIRELDVFAAYNNEKEGVWLYRMP